MKDDDFIALSSSGNEVEYKGKRYRLINLMVEGDIINYVYGGQDDTLFVTATKGSDTVQIETEKATT